MKLTALYYRHIVPAVTLLFLVGIVCSYFLIRHTLQVQLDDILLRSKSRIVNYVRQNNRLPETTVFNDQLVLFRPMSSVVDSTFTDTALFIPEQHKQHLSRKLSFTVFVDGHPWEAIVSQPLEGIRHLTILIAWIAVVMISATLILFLLINSQLLTHIWNPFYRSLELIQDFKVDESVPPPFPDTKIDEFRLMNAHFAKAAENASRDYRNLKEFSENASHELQTPLAIIRSNLDLLAQEGMTERQSVLLQGVYASVRKMSRLQESLLLLTKIDNRQFTGVDNIRIDVLIRDKVFYLQELLHARNLTCSLDLAEASVPANRELLDILLNNFFSNAIRHNVPGGNIFVSLSGNAFTISNTGSSGALDSKRIFRRFYKSLGQTDNIGLGLSIIKQICESNAMAVEYAFVSGMHSFRVSW